MWVGAGLSRGWFGGVREKEGEHKNMLRAKGVVHNFKDIDQEALRARMSRVDASLAFFFYHISALLSFVVK